MRWWKDVARLNVVNRISSNAQPSLNEAEPNLICLFKNNPFVSHISDNSWGIGASVAHLIPVQKGVGSSHFSERTLSGVSSHPTG
jgi:hypothetical protein